MIDNKVRTGQAKPAQSASQKQGADVYENRIIDVWSRTTRSYLRSMATLNEVAMQIANAQMSANADAAEMLGQCHDFNEAMKVHSKLVRCSGEACMRGWTRWLDASNELVTGAYIQTPKSP